MFTKKDFGEFHNTAPIDRHYMYAVNCFQHAVGFPLPLVVIDSSPKYPDMRTLNYVTLKPGKLVNNDYDTLTDEEAIAHLIDKCKKDGLEVLDRKFEQRDGFRTLALFVNHGQPRKDYHFAFLNQDNLWEDKVPFRGVRTYQNTTEIEKLTKYNFVSYLLCPEKLFPEELKTVEYDEIPLSSGKDGKKIAVITNGVSNLAGTPVIIKMGKDQAVLVEQKQLIPSPVVSNKEWQPFLVYKP